MTHDGRGPEPSNGVRSPPENTTARTRLDLQSPPYPLTHTYAPGVRFPLRG